MTKYIYFRRQKRIKKKSLGIKWKHLQNTKKNTFFYKYEKKIKISTLFPWFTQPQKPNKA
jgi:hypothetical protein